jgi:hypothetical protein
MSKVNRRIEQAPVCEVINLTNAEKDIYRGCGWKLARFSGGILVELFDPMDIEVGADAETNTKKALDNAVGWANAAIKNTDDEVWLAMCSCYQLCEPTIVNNAAAWAHVARIFCYQFAETEEF